MRTRTVSPGAISRGGSVRRSQCRSNVISFPAASCRCAPSATPPNGASDGEPGRGAAIRHGGVDDDWTAFDDWLDQRRRDLRGETGRTAAVDPFAPFFEKKKLRTSRRKHARSGDPLRGRGAAGEQIFVVVERNVKRRRVEERQLQIAETAALRRAPERVDVDVVLDHAVRAHLELRQRRARVPRSRLRERRDAARLQHACEFAQYVVGIRRVMKRIEAKDPFDAGVLEIDAASVELQKLRRGPIADRRLPFVQIARDAQRRRRNIEQDHAAAELRQESRQPSGAGAEFEHRHARHEPQSLQQRRHVDQDRRRFVRLRKRLGEVVLPFRQRREVLLGRSIQIVDRSPRDQFAHIDHRVGQRLDRQRLDIAIRRRKRAGACTKMIALVISSWSYMGDALERARFPLADG